MSFSYITLTSHNNEQIYSFLSVSFNACLSSGLAILSHLSGFFWHINYRHSSIKGRSPSSNPFQTVRPFMLLTGSRCGTLEVMKAIKNWRKPFTYKTKSKQKKTCVMKQDWFLLLNFCRPHFYVHAKPIPALDTSEWTQNTFFPNLLT